MIVLMPEFLTNDPDSQNLGSLRITQKQNKKKTKHEGREVHLGLGSYSCETCLAFTIWTCITFIETIQEVN